MTSDVPADIETVLSTDPLDKELVKHFFDYHAAWDNVYIAALSLLLFL